MDGFCGYEVVDFSDMDPAYGPRTLCFIDDTTDLEVGDILHYKIGNRKETKRIVDIDDNGYIVKGDNNDTAEKFPVDPQYIIGEVTYYYPGVGDIFTVIPYLGMLLVVLFVFLYLNY